MQLRLPCWFVLLGLAQAGSAGYGRACVAMAVLAGELCGWLDLGLRGLWLGVGGLLLPYLGMLSAAHRLEERGAANGHVPSDSLCPQAGCARCIACGCSACRCMHVVNAQGTSRHTNHHLVSLAFPAQLIHLQPLLRPPSTSLPTELLQPDQAHAHHQHWEGPVAGLLSCSP